MFDTQFQNRRGPEVARTAASASSTMRKASSTTNIVDDFSSIFGGSFLSKVKFSCVTFNHL